MKAPPSAASPLISIAISAFLLLPWLSSSHLHLASAYTQHEALVVLLRSTLPRPILAAPICSWSGLVRCAGDGSVTGLFLEGLRLRGAIPAGTLSPFAPSLTHLSLFNNSLLSPLPSADLSLLSRLHYLSLSSNAFHEPLPPLLWRLSSLQRLDLSSNRFFGSLPAGISRLPHLNYLFLASNAFTGPLPPDLRNLQSLSVIDLSNNSFSTSHGFSLSDFPALTELDLSYNHLSCNLSELLTNATRSVNVFPAQLRVLDLSRNAIAGDLSSIDFSVFPALDRLDLSQNRIGGTIPDSIGNGTNFTYIDLSNNRLQGRIPSSSLARLRYLSHLDLSSNSLWGNASELLSLKWLKFLNLSRNEAVGCDTRLITAFGDDSFLGAKECDPSAVNLMLSPPQSYEEGPRSVGLPMRWRVIVGITTAAIVVAVLALLLALIFCRRRRRRQRWRRWPEWRLSTAYREENSRYASGPFSFQSHSGPWSANIRNASSVPVVMFEKPLLKLTFADLLRATSNFHRETQVSQGGLGPVYSAVLPDGHHVSIKVLIEGRILTNEAAAAEFQSLSQIKHPNLVPLIGYCIVGEERLVIYEFMKNGGLHRWLLGASPPPQPAAVAAEEVGSMFGHYYDVSRDLAARENLEPLPEVANLSWPARHKVALGLARALAFLHHGHSTKIVHRDVKASNVMLDEKMEPRLANTGLAALLAGSSDALFAGGSPGYAPPEYGQAGGQVSTMGDVYSYGVVLLELVTGKKPVGDVYEVEAGGAEEVSGAGPPPPPPAPPADLASWIRGRMQSKKRKKGEEGLYEVLDRRAECEDAASREQMVAVLNIGYLCTAEAPWKRPTIQQVVGLLRDLTPEGAAGGAALTP